MVIWGSKKILELLETINAKIVGPKNRESEQMIDLLKEISRKTQMTNNFLYNIDLKLKDLNNNNEEIRVQKEILDILKRLK